MIFILLRTLFSALRSHRALILENLALRHQLDVLQRNAKKAVLGEQGSDSLGDPVAGLGRLANAAHFRPTRDRHPMAQERISAVLEMEEPTEMAGEAEASQGSP